MRNKIISIKALCVSALIGLCVTTANAEKLRIMTFNVPKGNIPAVGLNTWENRAKAIGEFLRKTKPDILGMQEPVASELSDLLALIPGYSMIGVARDDGNARGEFTPIIYRNDRFAVEHSGTYWLSTTPNRVSKSWNSTCFRIATWAVMRDRKNDKRFLYTNTHLEYLNTKPLDRQIRVVKEQMQKQLAAYGDMPAFLTGDFNNIGTEDTSPVIAARDYLVPMREAYNVTARHHGPTYTALWGKNADDPVKIDFIFITNEVKVNKTYIYNSWRSNGQQLSDHNAYYADVSWKNRSTNRKDR